MHMPPKVSERCQQCGRLCDSAVYSGFHRTSGWRVCRYCYLESAVHALWMVLASDVGVQHRERTAAVARSLREMANIVELSDRNVTRTTAPEPGERPGDRRPRATSLRPPRARPAGPRSSTERAPDPGPQPAGEAASSSIRPWDRWQSDWHQPWAPPSGWYATYAYGALIVAACGTGRISPRRLRWCCWRPPTR